MKQKDLALIIVVVFISTVISIFISKALFPPKNRQQPVEVVQPITADFPAPDSHYFNSQSFDPTKLIEISNNSNPNPFNGKP